MPELIRSELALPPVHFYAEMPELIRSELALPPGATQPCQHIA